MRHPLILRVREATSPPWDDLREQRVLQMIRKRRVELARRSYAPRRPKKEWRPVAYALVSAAAILIILGLWSFLHPADQFSTILRVGDYCQVFLANEAEVTVDSETPERLLLHHRAGAARYDVTPGTGRTIIVEVGDIKVRVVGTSFYVNRLDGIVRVRVRRGRVEVTHSDEVTMLVEGDSLTLRHRSISQSETHESEDSEEMSVSSENREKQMLTPRKRATAHSATENHTILGSENQSFSLENSDLSSSHGEETSGENSSGSNLPRERGKAVSTPVVTAHRRDVSAAIAKNTERQADEENAVSDVRELLRQADRARMSGRLSDALSLLRSALQNSNARERPMIFFTMGLVHRARGRHRDAAIAFSRCQDAAPYGSLNEDALAAEARAARAAGMQARSRRLATRYLESHPDGVHAPLMRRLVASIGD